MARASGKGKIEAAGDRLRAIVLEHPEGAMIGSEQAILAQLGVSRSTVRQVARLLEREGLLIVRRGINGGYYGARPSGLNIQHTVSAYLETLDMAAEDVTALASALWVVVIRKAATDPSADARAMADTFLKRVRAVAPGAAFRQIRALEIESRSAIFAIAKSQYIELIFNINTEFATWHFPPRPDIDGTPEHTAFVRAWQNAKVMELTAIFEGDPDLGALAARHIRNVWHDRVWLTRTQSVHAGNAAVEPDPPARVPRPARRKA